MILSSIEKEKNLLVLGFDNGKQATFDFITCKSCGVSNKPIQFKTFLSYLCHVSEELSDQMICKLLLSIKSEYICDALEVLIKIEQWFSCLDVIDFEEGYYGGFANYLSKIQIEKGFIPWLRSNNKKMNWHSHRDYVIWKIAKQLKGNEKQNQNAIRSLTYLSAMDDTELAKLAQTSIFEKLLQSLKTDFKNYNCPNGSELRELKALLLQYPELEQFLDANRGIKYNYKTIKTMQERTRNEKILANESRIYALEDFDCDDEIQIVVPHAMEDFAKEGKQQNNCVGHYYHNSIAQGNDLIYFLRKKDNVNKSFVTCRFNVRLGYSAETRIKNNDSYFNAELFNKIDKEIKRLLQLSE